MASASDAVDVAAANLLSIGVVWFRVLVEFLLCKGVFLLPGLLPSLQTAAGKFNQLLFFVGSKYGVGVVPVQWSLYFVLGLWSCVERNKPSCLSRDLAAPSGGGFWGRLLVDGFLLTLFRILICFAQSGGIILRFVIFLSM